MFRQPRNGFFTNKRVWITPHLDLIGSAIVRRLWAERCEIVLTDRSQLDLQQEAEVESWFWRQRPDVIFLAGRESRQGTSPATPASASRLHSLPLSSTNVLAAACGSVSATLVSVTETGVAFPAEPGLRLAGPGAGTPLILMEPALLRRTQGNGRGQRSRFVVLLASCVHGHDRNDVPRLLLRLFRQFAKAVRHGEGSVEIEGGGVLPYGLIHYDDLADAAVYVSSNYNGHEPVHCRRGRDASLRNIAELIAELTGYEGRIVLRKGEGLLADPPLASVSIRSLGWRPKVPFGQRIRDLYNAWRQEICGH